MSENGHKPTLLIMSLTKKWKPKTKFFFHCRLVKSFQGLNSSLAQSGKESYVVGETTEICLILGRFSSTMYSHTGSESVNTFRAGVRYIRT